MISINKARWIDRKIGRPICFFMWILLFFRKKKALHLKDIRKVLVIKMFGMGSIILASPVFYNLKRNYPNCKIFFMTLSSNKGLYEGSPYIDGSIYFDLSSFKSALISFCKIGLWLRKQRFDVVFDFEVASRFTAVLAFSSSRSIKVGYVPAGSGKAIFDVTIPYNESIHITRVYLRALEILGINIFNEQLLPLPVKAEERQRVRRFLNESHINNYIVFNPNASALAYERMWPLEYYSELGKRLFQYLDELAIVLIGGKEDKDHVSIVKQMLDPYGRVFSVAGQFSMRETAFLLSQAQVFVSNDSGPMHMGVIADVPTIGLFGPETPILFGPRGDNHKGISSFEICSPCISVYRDKLINCPKRADCMKKITVDDVLREVLERYQPVFVKHNVDRKSRKTAVKDTESVMM